MKNKILILFVQTYQKRKEFPYMERSHDNDRQKKESHKMSCDNDRQRREYPYMETSRDNDQRKDAYISKEMQLQNHSLTFIH